MYFRCILTWHCWKLAFIFKSGFFCRNVDSILPGLVVVHHRYVYWASSCDVINGILSLEVHPLYAKCSKDLVILYSASFFIITIAAPLRSACCKFCARPDFSTSHLKVSVWFLLLYIIAVYHLDFFLCCTLANMPLRTSSRCFNKDIMPLQVL